MKAEVGDWIRFYIGGVLVIGEVKYIRTNPLKDKEYLTDQGSCHEDSVLEKRPWTK